MHELVGYFGSYYVEWNCCLIILVLQCWLKLLVTMDANLCWYCLSLVVSFVADLMPEFWFVVRDHDLHQSSWSKVDIRVYLSLDAVCK